MPETGKIEAHILITLSSFLGTAADYVTTQVALKYPELAEQNPHVNFINEFLTANVGGEVMYGLARILKQTDDVSLALGLMPSAIPFGVALNNLAWIVWAHRKIYPWEECPLLYPE